MTTCSRLTLACLLLTFFVTQVGADEPPKNEEKASVWSDRSGKFRMKAYFIDIIDGKVVVLKRASDGKVIQVPLGRLSADSKSQAEDLHSRRPDAQKDKPGGTGDEPIIVRYRENMSDTVSINDVKLSNPPTTSELIQALGTPRYFPKKNMSDVARQKKSESDRIHRNLWLKQFLVWDNHGIVAKWYDRREEEDRISTIVFCYQERFTEKQMQCFPKKKFSGNMETPWGVLNGGTPDTQLKEYLTQGSNPQKEGQRGLPRLRKSTNDFFTTWRSAPFGTADFNMIVVNPNPFDEKQVLLSIELSPRDAYFTDMIKNWLSGIRTKN